MDDLGVRPKDDLQNDPGDRPLDGLVDDLLDDLGNHGANPRPYFWLRNILELRHLGRDDSFGCNERLNG